MSHLQGTGLSVSIKTDTMLEVLIQKGLNVSLILGEGKWFI